MNLHMSASRMITSSSAVSCFCSLHILCHAKSHTSVWIAIHPVSPVCGDRNCEFLICWQMENSFVVRAQDGKLLSRQNLRSSLWLESSMHLPCNCAPKMPALSFLMSWRRWLTLPQSLGRFTPDTLSFPILTAKKKFMTSIKSGDKTWYRKKWKKHSGRFVPCKKRWPKQKVTKVWQRFKYLSVYFHCRRSKLHKTDNDVSH